jgi:ABC-type polar amino acid transport system ATPase subunit
MTANPIVSIAGLNKWYGDFHVLRDIDLDVGRGERIVICGPSGSGKSTLIRCINALEEFQEGRIVVDGIELGPSLRRVDEVRREVGMVFQSFNLFPHLSVEQNITLAPHVVKGVPPAEARRLAESVLRKVGLADKIDAYPDELSDGQQQCVAIARSLAMAPQLSLFDDPELVGEMPTVLEELARDGMTMMLVTHDIGIARKIANRVVFLHQGKSWEEGPAAATLARPRTPELETFLGAVLH